MLRIGIVEDDEIATERLKAHLERFLADSGEAYRIETFGDGIALLEGYAPAWDLLFLDIQMPRVDGMTAARRIREMDSEVMIIFVTSSPHYAVSGYEVNALSYLLKPVTYTAFAQEMERAVARLRGRSRKDLLFTSTDGIRHRIAISDIRFVESVHHGVEVRTLDGDFRVADTLEAMVARLEPEGFARCNNGLLVNLRHVVGIDGTDCRIRGGGRLPISRRRKLDFLAALTSHIAAVGSTEQRLRGA